eukprot:CAMPEP_0181121372 /NCGR_PEP_ID=MMETSP1071-20121207/24705_1 /TAXON_ID=35127 /ORGANISM="Thalassiosira sp., Strain NH16" /LENGTH=720 /DNA_ID=CAMNT_0023206191 /DNA_START=76 /DNA_END=2238 /DNA_ORIENTATION=+
MIGSTSADSDAADFIDFNRELGETRTAMMSDESDTTEESATSHAYGHNSDDNTECAIKGDNSRDSGADDRNTKRTTAAASIATVAAERALGFAAVFRRYASSNCGAPRENLDVEEEAEEAQPSSYWYDGCCSARWAEGPPPARHGEESAATVKEEEGQRRHAMRFYDWRADPRMQYSFYDWRIGSGGGECCVPQSNGNDEHCAGSEEEKALAPKEEEEEEVSNEELVNRFCYDYPWSDISSLTEQREGTSSPLQDEEDIVDQIIYAKEDLNEEEEPDDRETAMLSRGESHAEMKSSLSDAMSDTGLALDIARIATLIQGEIDVARFFDVKKDNAGEDCHKEQETAMLGGDDKGRVAREFKERVDERGEEKEKEEAIGELLRMDEEDVDEFFGGMLLQEEEHLTSHVGDIEKEGAEEREQLMSPSLRNLHENMHRFYQISDADAPNMANRGILSLDAAGDVKEHGPTSSPSQRKQLVHRFHSWPTDECKDTNAEVVDDDFGERDQTVMIPSKLYMTSDATESGVSSIDPTTSASTIYHEAIDEDCFVVEAEPENSREATKDGRHEKRASYELDAAIRKLALAAYSAPREDDDVVPPSPPFESDIGKGATDTSGGNVDDSVDDISDEPSKDSLLRKEEVINSEKHISNESVHKVFCLTSEEQRNSHPELKDVGVPSSHRRFNLSSDVNASVTRNLELLRLYHEHRRTEGSLLDKYGFARTME